MEALASILSTCTHQKHIDSLQSKFRHLGISSDFRRAFRLRIGKSGRGVWSRENFVIISWRKGMVGRCDAIYENMCIFHALQRIQSTYHKRQSQAKRKGNWKIKTVFPVTIKKIDTNRAERSGISSMRGFFNVGKKSTRPARK